MGKFSRFVEALDPRKKQEEGEHPQRKETTVSYRREHKPKGMSRQQKEETCKRLLAEAKISQENRRSHFPKPLKERIQTVTVQVEEVEVTYAELDLNALGKGPKPQNKVPETIYAEIKEPSGAKNQESIYENLKGMTHPSPELLYERVFPWKSSGETQTKISLEEIQHTKVNLGARPKRYNPPLEMAHER